MSQIAHDILETAITLKIEINTAESIYEDKEMIMFKVIEAEGQQEEKSKCKMSRNVAEARYSELVPPGSPDGTYLEQFSSRNTAEFLQQLTFPQRAQLTRLSNQL